MKLMVFLDVFNSECNVDDTLSCCDTTVLPCPYTVNLVLWYIIKLFFKENIYFLVCIAKWQWKITGILAATTVCAYCECNPKDKLHPFCYVFVSSDCSKY
jgi:hypothetical protein